MTLTEFVFSPESSDELWAGFAASFCSQNHDEAIRRTAFNLTAKVTFDLTSQRLALCSVSTFMGEATKRDAIIKCVDDYVLIALGIESE